MPALIEAVFFDFDGLILDTEMPEVVAWQEMYAAHGVEFPDWLWAEMIGRSVEKLANDPFDLLRQMADKPLDRERLLAEHRQRRLDLISLEKPLPGVLDRIDETDALGLKKALVSSSGRKWVEGHLDAHRLRDRFPILFCGYEGLPSKPDPALYQAAVRHFNLNPRSALALEDSPNGIAAAKGAGVWCVAVPNALTRSLDLSQADARVESLEGVTVQALIQALEVRI